jgi:hypothetical protein
MGAVRGHRGMHIQGRPKIDDDEDDEASEARCINASPHVHSFCCRF